MDPNELNGLVRTGRVFDLGVEYFVGMPHHPYHPPFAFTLTKLHGDVVYEGCVSAANCLFTTGGHTGTHFDALGHISRDGRVHGVGDIGPHQDYHGLKKGGIDQVAPVVTRGVLLDVAGAEGVDCLGPDYVIGAETLATAADRRGIEIGSGDAVLIRTGWIKHFHDPPHYLGHTDGCPGLIEEAGQWLAEKGVGYVGVDTVALEKLPNPSLPVHVVLLVENGIHIIEVLNLEELAAEKVDQFLFMASPLKIRGGTASPVRPVAVT